MKTRTKVTALLIFLFACTYGQTQFLKKATKGAEHTLERSDLNKTGQKASEKTEKTLDSIFNLEIGQMDNSNVDPSVLPESYFYEWQYSLQMKHEKRVLRPTIT